MPPGEVVSVEGKLYVNNLGLSAGSVGSGGDSGVDGQQDRGRQSGPLSVKEVSTTAHKKAVTPGKRPHRPPATTPEGRENQLVSLAVDLAEQQLEKGTASAQVIVHYLRLGTTRERLEQERLKRENELLTAKVGALASAQKVEELYANALKAMRIYSGNPEPDDYAED